MGWTSRDSNSGWSKRFFRQTRINQPTKELAEGEDFLNPLTPN